MADQRRLAAVLAADMVGYSRLMEADESGTIARQKSHRAEIIDLEITKHNGRIVKTTGDGLLAEFASVVDAVKCAVTIQAAMTEREVDVSADLRIQYRVGINIGDIIVEGDDIFGDGVNVAARIEGLCQPGEVYLSGAAYDQVSGKLDFSFESLGEQTVKNISNPIRVYRVTFGDSVNSPHHFTQHSSVPNWADKPSIAVLPFNNISNDPEQEYFSDGITEDIITALSRLRQILVIARNTTFTYKKQNVDVRVIAKDLGVRYLLEGSVRKSKTRVRITAQLIDAHTRNHLWAEKFDRDLEDIFAVQDEITEAVVASVEPQITKSEILRARAKRPEKVNTWELYLQGLFCINRRSEGDIAEATRKLEQAIKIDPTYAPAYQELSYIFVMEAVRDLIGGPQKYYVNALKMAEEAVRLDPEDDRSHMAYARALMFLGRAEDAFRAIQDALNINPTSAYNQYMVGRILIRIGRAEEAIKYLEQSLKISPRDMWIGPFLIAISEAHLAIGNYETALEWSQRALRETNAIWFVPASLKILALSELGRNQEVQQAISELNQKFPNFSQSSLEKIPWVMNLPYSKELMSALDNAGLSKQ